VIDIGDVGSILVCQDAKKVVCRYTSKAWSMTENAKRGMGDSLADGSRDNLVIRYAPNVASLH